MEVRLESSTEHRSAGLYLITCEQARNRAQTCQFEPQKAELLAAVILGGPVLKVIRRELRRLSPDARVEIEEIKSVLTTEVLKREVLEGEKADAARKKVVKAHKGGRAATKPLGTNRDIR